MTEKRLADSETRLRRFQAAIEAGVDPSALVEAINEAQEQRAAAKAQLEGLPAPNLMTAAEAYARIDSLGDVGETLKQGSPENLSRLYRALHLQLNYHPVERALDATISVRVVSECVRGGIQPHKHARSPRDTRDHADDTISAIALQSTYN
ncbi:hypothetical protein [Kutzneria sp. CA-103260]|uniref:hypothetical protein n=1 Tax=Kutzneria sp. CA-103260 TaxID=2802641 RepID=UPI001BA533E7|nr:hypothetical protein [Kutzneria sp. CA-103260]